MSDLPFVILAASLHAVFAGAAVAFATRWDIMVSHPECKDRRDEFTAHAAALFGGGVTLLFVLTVGLLDRSRRRRARRLRAERELREIESEGYR